MSKLDAGGKLISLTFASLLFVHVSHISRYYNINLHYCRYPQCRILGKRNKYTDICISDDNILCKLV